MLAPTIVGYLKTHTTKGFGYFYVLLFFIGVNVIGFACNTYLYYIDIKYYDGILNNVDQGDKIEDLMTSPIQNRKELIKASQSKPRAKQSLLDYKLDSSARSNLKKSMA